MRQNLSTLKEEDLVSLSIHDERAGGISHPFAVVLPSSSPMILVVKMENGDVRCYRFGGTKLGTLYLPGFVAEGGIIDLWDPVTETAVPEMLWSIREISVLTDQRGTARALWKESGLPGSH